MKQTTGYVLIHRSIYDHLAFKNLVEASIFAWMISKASWQEAEINYRGIPVKLERAQLALSIRDLADRWEWSIKKARIYLERLKENGMITVENSNKIHEKKGHKEGHREGHKTRSFWGKGVTVLTICNYEEYQVTVKDRAQEERAEGHTEGNNRGNQNKETKETKEKKEALAKSDDLPLQGNLIEPEPTPKAKPKAPDAELYARGRKLLGKTSGGMMTKLLKAKGLDEALAIVALAERKDDPRVYIGAIIKGQQSSGVPPWFKNKRHYIGADGQPYNKSNKRRAAGP